MKGSVLFILLAVVLGIKLLVWPSITDFLELHKCPACYGNSLCPAFSAETITRDISSSKAIIYNILGSRNILLGFYLDKRVVLKKLGHNTELNQLDETICTMAGISAGCHVGDAIDLQQQEDMLHQLKQHVSQPFTSSLHLCPSSSHLEKLISNYEKSGDRTEILLANLWTVIFVNAEPLILQVLKAENGWPVPKYIGACGRVIVEEYVGEMLYTYHEVPWMQRADFSFQLLIAALNFTNSHPEFSFYLTDISPDNIAVNAQGKIRFVDLENVIVVDRNIPEGDAPPTWNIPHVSETIECKGDGCFAFSPEDICAHRISDHNVYAICQIILHPETAPSTLPGGLLHGTMPEHAHILKLVDECILSSDRFTVAQRLMKALQDVIQQHKNS